LSHSRILGNYSGFNYLQIKKRLSVRLLRYVLQSAILQLVRWPDRNKKAADQRRTAMKQVQGFAVNKMLFAALSIGLIFAGTAQAQMDLPVFTGKFTLTNPVQWGKTVLQPGHYTITIGSGTKYALVRDGKGRGVGLFLNSFDSRETSARNALLIRENGGQARVYALALASLGRVLVYDPVLAREAVMEARAPQTVPVILAKR
jgi:hypothetical protein